MKSKVRSLNELCKSREEIKYFVTLTLKKNDGSDPLIDVVIKNLKKEFKGIKIIGFDVSNEFYEKYNLFLGNCDLTKYLTNIVCINGVLFKVRYSTNGYLYRDPSIFKPCLSSFLEKVDLTNDEDFVHYIAYYSR